MAKGKKLLKYGLYNLRHIKLNVGTQANDIEALSKNSQNRSRKVS